MKFSFVASLLLASGLTLAGSAQADTLAYPSPDAASFMVDYPSSWEMTPGEAEGDYLTLMSEGGTTLMLRTLPGSADEVQEAVKGQIEYVQENYKNVALAEPADSTQQGLSGFFTAGTAKDSEIGDVKIAMAWYALNDGTIGEIWFVAPADDAKGLEQAGAILDSFRSP
jgi:hypothetical protein